jgi:succinate dehydrogenase / fumarate reductase cytochrome b subunit
MNNRTFVLRRLHSLAGVVPVGLFLIEHLYLNSYALKGPAAYNKVVGTMQGMPYLVPIEFLFILLPVFFHGIYGLWITWTSSVNLSTYSYYRNWMYYGQRVAGIVTFFFICYHFYALRLQAALFGTEVSFQRVVSQLHNPAVFLLYIIGTLAAVYHFSNGLFTFCITWGLTVGPRSQRVASIVFSIAFVAIAALGMNSLVAFR